MDDKRIRELTEEVLGKLADQPETADSGGGQIEGGGGAQTACPDALDRAVLQGLLRPPAEGGQGKVALIACLFAVGEHVERDWQGRWLTLFHFTASVR